MFFSIQNKECTTLTKLKYIVPNLIQNRHSQTCLSTQNKVILKTLFVMLALDRYKK